MSDSSPSRPQRGGGDEDVTVNKNPQGPVRVLGVATAEFLLWRVPCGE